MITRRHTLLLGSGCLASLALITQGAVAGSYPERPIRLVIPFVPGGAADSVGRPWAERMKVLLGPAFVENQAGAGGIVGAAAVAHAQSDGYTLLLGSGGPLVVMPIAGNHASYDPIRDFAPISMLAVSSLGIIVHPSIPPRDLRELVDYANANPGKLFYGSTGVGSTAHLTGELFKSLTGTNDIVHIPYKGGGQAITDLVGGQILMAIIGVTGQVLELHQAGKLRLLSVTAPSRIVAATGIPTAVEQGFPDLVARAFFGLFAPSRTPAAIVERISDATRRALADDDFRQKLIASGFESYVDSSPEEARRFVQHEIDRWRPVILAIGLKLGMRNIDSKKNQREG